MFEELDGPLQRGGELFGFQHAAMIQAADAALKVDRRRRRGQHELHHLRRDDVVGETLVAAFDDKLAAELDRFEVDVVEADGAGDAIEEAFAADEQVGSAEVRGFPESRS